LAAASRERHRLVRDFLVALGVDPETAEADAEGIEHHVSDSTLATFRNYLAKVRRSR
jgi:DtxR family manganese transport transcriptional regulator